MKCISIHINTSSSACLGDVGRLVMEMILYMCFQKVDMFFELMIIFCRLDRKNFLAGITSGRDVRLMSSQ
jgi:hypothetical protein